MSLSSETMTKYHCSFKSRKNMLIHIPSYKLNRIKDKTYKPLNVLPRSDKTYSASLKKHQGGKQIFKTEFQDFIRTF